MKEVAYWIKKEKITERNILFSPHSWLFYFLKNEYETQVLLYFEQFKKYHEKILSYENIVASEPGTILIWNRKYGESIIDSIEREENLRLIKTFFTVNENNTPFVYVYEKVQPSVTIR